MRVGISKGAKKQLKSFSKAIQIILAKRIRELEKSHSSEKKLIGFKNAFRTRVGDYRIVYKRTSEQVYIVLIGHRKEIYRLLRGLLK